MLWDVPSVAVTTSNKKCPQFNQVQIHRHILYPSRNHLHHGNSQDNTKSKSFIYTRTSFSSQLRVPGQQWSKSTSPNLALSIAHLAGLHWLPSGESTDRFLIQALQSSQVPTTDLLDHGLIRSLLHVNTWPLFRANRFFPLGFPGLKMPNPVQSVNMSTKARGSVKISGNKPVTTLSGVTTKRQCTNG
jgi:hypothetical protein